MLRHFLIITLRNGFRQPLHAVLNLSCLGLGLAATLLIGLYLHFELTYDRFHANAARIYRVETKSVNLKGKVLELGWKHTQAVLGAYIQQDFPQVENYARVFKFFKDEEVQLVHGGKRLGERDVYAADPSVLEMFSFSFVAGNPRGALDGPNQVVLSQELARRLFGTENPVGKILNTRLTHNLPGFGEGYALLVTGVYRDLPDNTHLPVAALISAKTDPGMAQYYFGTYNTFTYLLLSPTADAKSLAPKLAGIYGRYLDPAREPVMTDALHELVPLRGIHLAETGGPAYAYLFGAVGVLLLLIAVISYVNLVTAQAGRRATEIGIRKVLGSGRGQLVGQFLAESLLFSGLALGLAVVLVGLSVGPLNRLLGLRLQVEQLGQPVLLGGMLLLVPVIGLLGGGYPAFFLSSFRPLAVLKGRFTGRAPLRRLLVAVQFAVVIFVLSCTGMIYDQLQYLRRKNLGFDKEHVVRLRLPGEAGLKAWPAFREQLLQSPYVSAAATGDFIPGVDNMGRWPMIVDRAAGEPQMVRRAAVDYDFFPALDIPLVHGRNFSRRFPTDPSRAVVVNQAFLRQYGLRGGVGETVRFGNRDNPVTLEIVGVIADFHQSPLHSPIEAQVFLLAAASPHLVVKVGRDLPAAVAYLERAWRDTMPGAPFDYRFLDEELQDGYKADQVRGRVFLSFSLLTLGIAFLGLFGLAAYLAGQRTREVGIRKVLGAGTAHLVLLLTRDFLLLVTIAALPAFGVAWYTLRRWLENFAYRAEMNYLLFALVLAFTLLLTFGVTGLHAFRTARLNPADTLKHE
ncbi:MAG: Acidobacterial duplicated orphan permease (function unknown) [uncultured Cytophagales bacterium]|uniref:ABC transporter, fused permease protein n=1 Tax=uncultured Cytophagales bacterium TaxID=158755 RepID=A0A6J4HU50_9SPHI|nr:MAG: Acidobacterial duplicated orphan permease (function unknown) [uncultured Cytophagales bacterium]